jgi:hypothetical protein
MSAWCQAGTIFGNADLILHSCNPFHATGDITLADHGDVSGGVCGDPHICCCGTLEIAITE